MKIAGAAGKARGVFLTLDSMAALLLLFTVVVVSFSYYSGARQVGYESELLRVYLQDASTMMALQGSFSSALDSYGYTNTSSIASVLRAVPPSVCMDVAAYSEAPSLGRFEVNTLVTEGLVGHWKLDDGSGTIATDSSGNGLIARLIGPGAAFVPDGVAGGAAGFDGAYSPGQGGYAWLFNNSGLEPDSLSVSSWVNIPSSDGTDNYVAGNWPGYSLRLTAANQPYLEIAGSDGQNHTVSDWRAIPYGKWVHLAGTFDSVSGIGSLYIDSELASSQNIGTGIMYSRSNFTISADPSWGGSALSGMVDDVRVYNRALSAGEIRALYSNPNGLLYVVGTPDCPHSGEEVRVLSVPFVHSSQDKNDYYRAVLRAWYRGSG